MKSEEFQRVALFLVVLVVGAVFWLFTRTPDYTASATVIITSDNETSAPKVVVQPSRVAMPTAPAITQAESVEAPTQADNAAEAVKDDSAEAVSIAQAEAKAAVLGVARTIREQGIFGAELVYLPPAQSALFTPKEIPIRQADEARYREIPEYQQELEHSAQMYEYIATLTPTINATGDKATFHGAIPSDLVGSPSIPYMRPEEQAQNNDRPHIVAIFIKIDGHWYFKNDWTDEQ